MRLCGLGRADLANALSSCGVTQSFRGDQVWRGLYHQGAGSFAELEGLPKKLHAVLQDRLSLELPRVLSDQLSRDGCRKFLIAVGEPTQAAKLPPAVECVFIPEDDRGTLCVSSQIGCSLSCTFCHTGTQPLSRNLTAAEIVQQVMVARRRLGDFPLRNHRAVTNVVFMGEGEPLYNYRQVIQAVGIMSDPQGLELSPRKITVSTSGVAPAMVKMGAEDIGLALSLHSPNNELRSRIMDINRTYPIESLMEACVEYQKLCKRRITFEYVMLRGVNDSPALARDLVHLIKSYELDVLVNLIPFNPWPGVAYDCSTVSQMTTFQESITSRGILATIRWSRGEDILAACGTLKSSLTAQQCAPQ